MMVTAQPSGLSVRVINPELVKHWSALVSPSQNNQDDQ